MAVQHTVAGTVVKERHPLGPLGLSILTLGIYGLVWYYKINKELRDVTGQGSPGVSLLAITLGAVLIVPPFVSWFNTAERIRVMQDRAGVPTQISSVVALVQARPGWPPLAAVPGGGRNPELDVALGRPG